MNKKRIFKAFLILGIVYLILFAFVFTIYHLRTYDPHNEVAVPYIWDSTEISEKYGKIVSICRDKADGVVEYQNSVIVPYGIETEKFTLSITVTLIQEKKEWIVEKLEIIEVNEIGN